MSNCPKYDRSDITIGQFLEQHCFNTTSVCQVSGCGRPLIEHERTFVHASGRLHVSVDKAEENVKKKFFFGTFFFFLELILSFLIILFRAQFSVDLANQPVPILMWSFCKKCKTTTPSIPMSLESWSISFGKYLELSFYASDVISRNSNCKHSLFRDHVRYFYHNNYVSKKKKKKKIRKSNQIKLN